MDANGANPIPLTSSSEFNSEPVWSPDGAKIAFTSERDGNDEVYVMDADGMNQINLTNNTHEDAEASWSPDGTKILFTSDRGQSFRAIYIMNANGSNPVQFTFPTAGFDTGPVWSPDGTKITFSTNRNGNYEIYVMNADGSNQIRLTTNSALDSGPDWAIAAASVTPSPTPTATISVSPTPTPSATPTGSPTTTPTATPTPTTTPVPTPAQALNISTRLQVQTGNNVLIGGFIVTGTAPKDVAVRGIGPSLAGAGVPDPLADPTLELHESNGTLIMQNDNWQDDPGQAALLQGLGLAPQDPLESGLVTTLSPNAAYTAILAGKDGGTGVGLVEIYDANRSANSQLANISTRGFVLSGNDVMIGGFILGAGNNTAIVVRGIGPSLTQVGITDPLADPTLELHDGNGALLISNDNWEDDSAMAGQLTAHGLALTNPNESGIYASLSPGPYTAILAGKDGATGVGLVEVYNLQGAAHPERFLISILPE